MNPLHLLLPIAIAFAAAANSQEAIPENYDKESLWDSHGPISVKKLDNALQPGKKLEQRLAYLYVYGVLDMSEGTVWCNSYADPIGPEGIKELARDAIRKAVASTPDERAAKAIIDEFKKISPCKGE